MLGLGLSLQKGVSAFNAGRALVSSYIRRVTDAGGVLQNTACDVAAINELNQDRLLEPASWVLVPDGIKEDVVYAQKPSTGLGDLTFTRASDATYTDSTGVVRRSPYNLVTYSEDFTNGAWFKTGVTITADATTAPNGTTTADKIIATATSGNHFATRISTPLTGEYTYSVFAKASEYSVLKMVDANAGVFNTTFDLSAGTASGTGAAIQSVGSGWYRCSVTYTSSGSSVANALAGSPSTSINYAGDGTSGIFIWGAQLVEGTEALDYFPTTNRQDVPRIDFRNADGTLSSCGRLLLEPQRTNSIRNSSMVGAVAGTPGTLPTNWSNAGSAISTSIVGSGTENGLPYVDIRLYGTAAVSTSGNISFETNTQIAASNAQTWTGTLYAKIIAQPQPPLSYNLIISERNSSGDFINENIYAFTPTTSLQRFFGTKVLSGGATTAFIVSRFRAVVTLGQTYDFTIRIAAPQMELGAYATTWVPTTTAAVTRLADNAGKTGLSSLIGQTDGTLFLDFVYNGRSNTLADNFNLSLGTWASEIITIGQYNNALYARIYSSSVLQFNVDFGIMSVGQRYKAAIAYSSNDAVFYVNGSLIGSDNTVVVPAVSSLYFNRGSYENSKEINQAALFPTRLTNDQLEVLTSEGYGNYALLAQSLNCVLQ